MKIYVPPIKSQGIKTKLVPWIKSIVPEKKDSRWIEPFMGTGVVGFNMNAFNSFIMSDTNPHLINFYNTLKNKKINSLLVKEFLQNEGEKLKNKGSEYYYEVRERFNKSNSPLDFLFLNRSCFNGIIRFNRKGEFNVPYCHKDNRFSQSYITKIINQVKYVQDLLLYKDFTFNYLDFSKTISIGGENDIIYCDPPYISRYSDYFNGWNEVSEQELAEALKDTSSNFILSTWYKNKYRENEYIKSIWNKYNIITKEHFYHIGGKEKNRNSMLEALITNFDIIEKSINNKNDNQEKLLLTFG